jgi:cytidylate kinase
MVLIAIDGPGGSGKSTLARNLAQRLGVQHLDTGAMYRAVALAGMRRAIDPGAGEELGALARTISLEVNDEVILDGEDVTNAIRAAEIDAVVSLVAAHLPVRHALVERQRAWVKARGSGVVEGRDIGTVVLPDADLKIYLTASVDERARRRSEERVQPISADAERTMIAARDVIDSTRTHSPLLRAPDAHEIDTTGKSAPVVLEEVLMLLKDNS